MSAQIHQIGTPWGAVPVSDEHAEHLSKAAITPAVALAAKVRTIEPGAELPEGFGEYIKLHLPAIAFEWQTPSGRQITQLRPDEGVRRINDKGDPIKYEFARESGGFVGVVRDVPRAKKALLVEGTKQALAAATHAPDDVAVYGIPGCWGWSERVNGEALPTPELRVFDGIEVTVCFDADITSKREVWQAAERLERALKAQGATVRWLVLPAGGTTGLDDYLAREDADRRLPVLRNLMAEAATRLPGKPTAASAGGSGSGGGFSNVPAGFVGADRFFSQQGALLAEQFALAIINDYPAALTSERKVALYRNGVYHLDRSAMTGVVTDMLSDRYRRDHQGTVESFLEGELFRRGALLPPYCNDQVVNLRNGVLDLATGELLPHDPGYLSIHQLPIEWEPGATCPTYEAWAAECIPGQLDDLEEVTATMLDASRTPTKAMFLFGPSRSGKSTFLRLMQAAVGPENISAVTLHQLVQNRFMAANVYGKILNVAADLSSAHIEDIDIFKILTGEDPIQADRKYGGQFTFTNRALFAFSANTLPTVGEASDAYVNRIKPFEFGHSFAGRENPDVEVRMREELPGILARWVRAWQRMHTRGFYQATDVAVMHRFEINSDRVLQWAEARAQVWPVASPHPASKATKASDLRKDFQRWCEDNGYLGMGLNKFSERLRKVGGVHEVRVGEAKLRLLNVTIRKDGDDGDRPFGDPEVAPPTAEVAPPTAEVAPLVAPLPPSGATQEPQVAATISSQVALVAPLQPQTSYTQENPTRRESNLITTESEIPPALGLSQPSGATSATTLDRVDLPLSLPATSTLPEGVLALDIETASEEQVWRRGPEFVRLVGFQRGDQITITSDPHELTRQLADATTIVGHNVMAFDLVAYAKEYGVDLVDLAEAGRVFDTKLAAILNTPPTPGMSQGQIQRAYSLDSLGEALLDAKKTGDLKGLAKEFGGFDKIPVDDARYVEYLRGDVDLTARLATHLRTSPYVKREHRVAAIAAQIRMNGFRVDLPLLQERYEAGQARRAELIGQLTDRYALPTTKADGKACASPHATKEGKAAIIKAFSDLGVDLPRTPKGAPSFGQVALAQVLELHDDEAVVELVETIHALNGVRTVYGTVLDYLVGDRVHPEIGLFQASGRWSTTKPGLTVFGKRGGRHVEREIFLPEDGHVIIAADLAQVDARALAALSQDTAYLAMFAPGLDLHTEVALRVFGDAGRRDEAKAIGHGWNYGMGTDKLARQAKVSEAVAVEFDQRMTDEFPRLVEWRDEVRATAKRGEDLDNGFGRRLRVDPNRAWTQAPALMGQGCARDLMMEGLLRLPKDVLPYLRAVVHDEIVMSVPLDVIDEVERVVIDALSFPWTPIGQEHSVQIEASLSWKKGIDGTGRGRNWGHVYEEFRP